MFQYEDQFAIRPVVQGLYLPVISSKFLTIKKKTTIVTSLYFKYVALTKKNILVFHGLKSVA